MSNYAQLPATPGTLNAVNVLSHVLDTTGFRFYWATEGLSDADLAFSPAEGAMTLGRQMAHIRRLLQWTDVAMQSRSERVKEVEDDFETMRNGTFEALDALKRTISQLGDEGLAKVETFGFPVWNLINGPMTDCLTHIGQINSCRRMLGKPCRAINYFSGKVE